ncbi:MAG TPA: bifunctional phosphopantothenoylcysteine decarboxylase/phosphopantothenate synthase, partial [Rhodospirillales bacterium]|nr:bifunctional phosphopantothenoylcysteine decarboxylase/phosphopantothenate synthase [Rhodospirillales bacterium]
MEIRVLKGKSILLIVSGSIAAYKSPSIVRGLLDHGATVRCVLTQGGSAFVTPLTLSALSGKPVYDNLFSLTDENEMGHIRLA